MRISVLTIFIFLISNLSAKAKQDSVICESYSVEIIDSLFFEQIDSQIMSQIDFDSLKLYQIWVWDQNMDNHLNFQPQINDTLTLSVAEVETHNAPQFDYYLNYNHHRYLISCNVSGLFIKRKKRIKVKVPKYLTIADLAHRAWVFRWINNEPIQLIDFYDNRPHKVKQR